MKAFAIVGENNERLDQFDDFCVRDVSAIDQLFSNLPKTIVHQLLKEHELGQFFIIKEGKTCLSCGNTFLAKMDIQENSLFTQSKALFTAWTIWLLQLLSYTKKMHERYKQRRSFYLLNDETFHLYIEI